MLIKQVAQVCHEINAAYCASLGDLTQPSWDSAPEWQQQSAMNGVRFHLDNPDALPSASHESWMAEKTKEGWVYGEVKDPIAKTHPCYVPYAELPVSQQSKDFLFKQTVHSLRPFLSIKFTGLTLHV